VLGSAVPLTRGGDLSCRPQRPCFAGGMGAQARIRPNDCYRSRLLRQPLGTPADSPRRCLVRFVSPANVTSVSFRLSDSSLLSLVADRLLLFPSLCIIWFRCRPRCDGGTAPTRGGWRVASVASCRARMGVLSRCATDMGPCDLCRCRVRTAPCLPISVLIRLDRKRSRACEAARIERALALRYHSCPCPCLLPFLYIYSQPTSFRLLPFLIPSQPTSFRPFASSKRRTTIPSLPRPSFLRKVARERCQILGIARPGCRRPCPFVHTNQAKPPPML